MTTRTTAPQGAPCWTDLWTSDVEGSRRFYSELFGWEAAEPSEEFGGYFMFLRDGMPIAGGMGPMGDEPAGNVWSTYLATDDVAKTTEAALAHGATTIVAPMPIADLGSQAVVSDPTGAAVGMWQAETFPGFVTLDEHGAPSWFELFTRDHPKALAFYEAVFHWTTDVVGDTDDFRYSTVRNADAPGPSGPPEREGGGEVAGVMDASAFLPEGVPDHWSVYWYVDDVAVTVARVADLGGTVIATPEQTPYGTLATVADPAGAQFKLRTVPAEPASA